MAAKVKAFLVVLGIAFIMWLLWTKYYDFLNQGRSAPESSKILNEIEKNGIPAFTIKSIKGEEINLDQFKGKTVVLNFWASWCEPCIAEFPSLIKLIEHFKGEVILLAISADYEEKDIELFMKTFKSNSPHIYVAWDKEYSVAKKFGTVKLPESFIIGKDGRLIRKISGVDDWSTPDALSYFSELVNDVSAREPLDKSNASSDTAQEAAENVNDSHEKK